MIAFGRFEGNKEDARGQETGDDPGESGGADVGGERGAAGQGGIIHLGEEQKKVCHRRIPKKPHKSDHKRQKRQVKTDLADKPFIVSIPTNPAFR